MRELPDISHAECGYSQVLEIVSSKWTALAFYAMEGGTIRYGEMLRRIDGISQKMLTQTLKQLERDGIIHRNLIPSVPPITEYSLTPLGESLRPIMTMFKVWAAEHYGSVRKAREEYDSQTNSG